MTQTPIQTKNDPEKKREFFSFGHTNFSEELGLVKEGQRQRGRKCCSREEKPNGLSQYHRIEEIFSRAKQLMFMGSRSQTQRERHLGESCENGDMERDLAKNPHF
jgi:hypothetical protein